VSNLLTISRMRTRRDCQRKHRLMYLDGWRPVKQDEAQSFGSLVHTGLEAWWRGEGNARLIDTLEAIAGKGADPFEQVAAEELLTGYHAWWGPSADRYDVLAVEETFLVPLLNPETGAPSRTWVLAGKVDGVVRDRHTGSLLILEHKTTTENFADAADSYWTKLAMDFQVSQYFLGAEGLGHSAEGCLYDVLLRPRQKPLKATPEESRKYTAKGQLYANQRAEDETSEEYRLRVRADIETSPAKYFARKEIARTDRDIVEYLGDVWSEGRAMRDAELAGRHPRNPDSCDRYGRCPFWNICAYGLNPADHPELFERVENVHPELELQETA
jgi:hypothetical protein